MSAVPGDHASSCPCDECKAAGINWYAKRERFHEAVKALALEGGDPIDHPAHYTRGRFEVIDVIEDWDLGFCLGNAIKYIARASHKGRYAEDLRKALWYLQREIAAEEKAMGTTAEKNPPTPTHTQSER